MTKVVEIELEAKTYIETGEIARQSDGAVVLKW